MNICITGDSHTAALKLGLEQLANENGLPQDWQIVFKPLGKGGSLTKPFFVDRGGFAELTNAKHKRLPLAEEEGVFDFYGISAPFQAYRILKNKDYWDKYSPFLPSPPDQAPVSMGLFRHLVMQDQRYIIKLIELFKRIGINIFVIESPKPFRHNPVVQQIGLEKFAYIDQLYRKIMRAWLDEKAIPVIDIPNHCYDSDGFMHEIYRHDKPADRQHANQQFGATMMLETIAFIKSKA